MSDLTKLTIAEAREGLKKKEFSSVELTKAYIEKMEANRKLNAFVLETPEIALAQAKISDEKYAKGTNGILEGIPLGIKDLFCTKGIRTTACSHILDGFEPQYESTVTGKLLEAGASILGKLNLDEFAMAEATKPVITVRLLIRIRQRTVMQIWLPAVLPAVRLLPLPQICAPVRPERIPAVLSASLRLFAA